MTSSESAAPSQGSFSGPPIEVEFQGLLFDMDGTIIDSTDAVVKHWASIAKEVNVDPGVILATSHGRRSIDVLKILSPERANWEYVQKVESVIPTLYGENAKPIPGAHSLITSLTPDPSTTTTTTGIPSSQSPPTPCPWAIVTSGSLPLVSGWLKLMALPPPLSIVSAEDVEHGKPNPSCYLLGLERIGLLAPPVEGAAPDAPSHHPHTKAEIDAEEAILKEGTGNYAHKNEHVLVLEDSPAGIVAGKAAGCKVLAVVTSHTVEQVLAAGPDWVVQDLSSVSVVRLGGDGVGKGVRLRIEGVWVGK